MSASRKACIIVATDYATRYVEAKALVNQKTTRVAKFIL